MGKLVPVPIALAEELSVTLYPIALPTEPQYKEVPSLRNTLPLLPGPYTAPLAVVGAFSVDSYALLPKISPINLEAPLTIKSFS